MRRRPSPVKIEITTVEGSNLYTTEEACEAIKLVYQKTDFTTALRFYKNVRDIVKSNMNATKQDFANLEKTQKWLFDQGKEEKLTCPTPDKESKETWVPFNPWFSLFNDTSFLFQVNALEFIDPELTLLLHEVMLAYKMPTAEPAISRINTKLAMREVKSSRRTAPTFSLSLLHSFLRRMYQYYMHEVSHDRLTFPTDTREKYKYFKNFILQTNVKGFCFTSPEEMEQHQEETRRKTDFYYPLISEEEGSRAIYEAKCIFAQQVSTKGDGFHILNDLAYDTLPHHKELLFNSHRSYALSHVEVLCAMVNYALNKASRDKISLVAQKAYDRSKKYFDLYGSQLANLPYTLSPNEYRIHFFFYYTQARFAYYLSTVGELSLLPINAIESLKKAQKFSDEKDYPIEEWIEKIKLANRLAFNKRPRKILPSLFGSYTPISYGNQKLNVAKWMERTQAVKNHFRDKNIIKLNEIFEPLLECKEPFYEFPQAIKKTCFWKTDYLAIHLLKNLTRLFVYYLNNEVKQIEELGEQFIIKEEKKAISPVEVKKPDEKEEKKPAPKSNSLPYPKQYTREQSMRIKELLAKEEEKKKASEALVVEEKKSNTAPAPTSLEKKESKEKKTQKLEKKKSKEKKTQKKESSLRKTSETSTSSSSSPSPSPSQIGESKVVLAVPATPAIYRRVKFDTPIPSADFFHGVLSSSSCSKLVDLMQKSPTAIFMDKYISYLRLSGSLPLYAAIYYITSNHPHFTIQDIDLFLKENHLCVGIDSHLKRNGYIYQTSVKGVFTKYRSNELTNSEEKIISSEVTVVPESARKSPNSIPISTITAVCDKDSSQMHFIGLSEEIQHDIYHRIFRVVIPSIDPSEPYETYFLMRFANYYNKTVIQSDWKADPESTKKVLLLEFLRPYYKKLKCSSEFLFHKEIGRLLEYIHSQILIATPSHKHKLLCDILHPMVLAFFSILLSSDSPTPHRFANLFTTLCMDLFKENAIPAKHPSQNYSEWLIELINKISTSKKGESLKGFSESIDSCQSQLRFSSPSVTTASLFSTPGGSLPTSEVKFTTPNIL